MKKIKLFGKWGSGKYALVDDENFEELNKFKWYLLKVGYPAYREPQINKVAGGYIYMHRKIMDTPKGMLTDHINMDVLDNQKENLRICSQAENLRNRLKAKSNSSGYKGVSWDKQKNKWATHITKNYKHIFCGFFCNKKEASEAYNIKAKELFGEFAKLNTN